MKFKRRQVEDKMGLDMYAYVAAKAGQQDEFYEGAMWDEKLKESVNPKVARPRELAYWRKHPNLHGWMEKLWIRKLANEGKTPETSDFGSSFNGVELELTWDDIDKLEQDIKSGSVANLNTTGFFFGNPVDDYYRQYDLEFVKNARAELFVGLKVFYNSSW